MPFLYAACQCKMRFCKLHNRLISSAKWDFALHNRLILRSIKSLIGRRNLTLLGLNSSQGSLLPPAQLLLRDFRPPLSVADSFHIKDIMVAIPLSLSLWKRSLYVPELYPRELYIIQRDFFVPQCMMPLAPIGLYSFGEGSLVFVRLKEWGREIIKTNC